MAWLDGFDADGPISADAGIYGLPCPRDDAAIVLVPVPFDATCSYRRGCAHGPAAIRRASEQLDLFDHQLGDIYTRGIFMEDAPDWIESVNTQTRAHADRVWDGAMDDDERRLAIKHIDDAGERVRAHVHERVTGILEANKTPGVVGGEHSVSLGAIEAVSAHTQREFGVLQIDAHMDLRPAYAGMTYSHASVMRNALERSANISHLVQVGIRDYSKGEHDFVRASKHRVETHIDLDWHKQREKGARLADLVDRAIEPLPLDVYVTFDIDALDPALCPNAGTPVPGGLSFNDASILLARLYKSGRRVIGFDFVETSTGDPPSGRDTIDSIAAARLLYKLCGCVRLD